MLLLVISLTGCASTDNGAKSTYNEGTYTAVTPGHNGDITVEVTFDQNSITDIKVTDHKETYGIS